jgi:hypothetical protein
MANEPKRVFIAVRTGKEKSLKDALSGYLMDPNYLDSRYGIYLLEEKQSTPKDEPTVS